MCIVNWNTKDDVQECLRALRLFPWTGGLQEIIVVDNGSGDGSAAMVRAEFPEAVLIANPANESYAHGTNQALARATGDYLLLLNPDARVTNGALDALVHALNGQANAGAVAARLVGADGTTQPSVRGFPDPWPLLWDILTLSRLFSHSRTFGTYRRRYFDYEQFGPRAAADGLVLSANPSRLRNGRADGRAVSALLERCRLVLAGAPSGVRGLLHPKRGRSSRGRRHNPSGSPCGSLGVTPRFAPAVCEALPSDDTKAAVSTFNHTNHAGRMGAYRALGGTTWQKRRRNHA